MYLRYAIVVAEHGSFRSAAAALDISQSTATRRVQLMERRLGVALFARSRSGARPTAAGALFIREAAFGDEPLRQAIAGVTAGLQGGNGLYRVGIKTRRESWRGRKG